MPVLTVVGDASLADRLVGTVADRPTIVIGGAVADRFARVADAVGDGSDVFTLWPPTATAAQAETLAKRADEAGVEVGVARPLGAVGVPDGWTARLVALTVVARTGSALADAGWDVLLAGVADRCLALTRARDTSRLDVVAERDGDAVRAIALSGRVETGATVQAVVRLSDHADGVMLYASRPGSRVEAQSLDGPLCVEVEGQRAVAPQPLGDVADEVRAFVARTGRPTHGLEAASATMRLVERVREQLR